MAMVPIYTWPQQKLVEFWNNIKQWIASPGSGVFIGYLNDMHMFLWNQTPYTQEVYKEKQIYMYSGKLKNEVMYLY